MKTTKLMTGVLALAALALAGGGAWAADANPLNDSAVFTVRITPNVDLGVTVNTTGSKWADSGTNDLNVTQDLGTDELLSVPVGIAMAGNFNNQELTLQGAALNTWTLDTDEVDRPDQLRLYAMFGRFGYAASPTTGEITGAVNLIKTGATAVGQAISDESTDNNHVYELVQAGTEYADMDGMLANATRKLWLRSRTPSVTSVAGQMAFTVTVTAVSGVTQ